MKNRPLGPLMIDVSGTKLSASDKDLLMHPLVGGVILFTRNYQNKDQLKRLVKDIKSLRNPELLVSVDHEGGRVQRFRDEFIELPAVGELADTDNISDEQLLLAKQHAFVMATEVLSCGIDISFAPCVDLNWGVSDVIGNRAFHQYPTAVTNLATAYLEGMTQAGMAATAKHFPGHGAVVADSHIDLPVDRRPIEAIREDIIPYRGLIDNGLQAVMMAHVVFERLADLPAGFSNYWVERELRGRLGFNGVVFTDDLCMEAAVMYGDIERRAHLAFTAGCDMALVCNNRPEVIKLIDTLEDGRWPNSGTEKVQQRYETLRAKPNFKIDDFFTSKEWTLAVDSLQHHFPDMKVHL